MRFSLAIFATVAMSAFTSASPVVVRDSSVMGVQAILTKLQSTLTPLVSELASIKSNNATSAVVGPIITEITTAISTATNSSSALKGLPQSVVLSSATSNEVVPLATVTKLVVDILTLLIPTLAKLVVVLGPGGDLTAVLPPVGAGLSVLVASLLAAVAGLVAQLIPALTGLLAGVSSLVTTLGLGGLIVALGL
ncbi:hypothetical protein FIBSPDRAFT_1045430 [Athelia psychrophila]|uniref:Uncharacterized protein n=1 Tax=Athelia psychrophila TaxID=1759441 RepID=A0A166I1F6_9AGAM|nr:hypothetical protein FIBSPDRAFT_1045430 [Fibularhizoctonia sp. CBS 109695]